MVNRVRELWRQGKVVVNGWLLIPNGFSAEMMAQAGWDSMTVDLQHGVQDYMSMVACFQAIQAQPVLPLVRIPANEAGIVGKVLDAGAHGVICPMINTAVQAREFVASCKYPPVGRRSNGPVRAGLYAGDTPYQRTANAETLCIPMIETMESLKNLESILDVPGVDAVYVGPTDLGFSLGLGPALDRGEPDILAAYQRILRETAARGVHAGIHCASAIYAVRMIEMSFRMVTVGWDSAFINAGARAALAAVRTREQT
jgi:4-hydroxy-2-oxoheptanedioate aldolase